MHIERSVTIPRPREAVFEHIRDPNDDPGWCPDVLSSRQVVGDGPEVGAEYEQRHDPGPGSPSDLHVEILSLDPPRSMTVRSSDDLAVFEVTYTLEELPDGATRLTQSDDIHVEGLRRLLLPVLWIAVNAGIRKQFGELRRQLARTTGHPA